ncbi:related to MICROSOMAL GLUTATHIONE S-TRANSFERASE 3 [Cephalotrichum gorgonifer]|uniref:Related to MICROSOMAL GLUTATHIONE S-TRANSFERASE 3 n=1 Tax=Cephalotrichum gorgonifer TaxID=2041049 RepID=A0AAE8STJ7_9PEZI|nr:related to MICROSOMAL GLUTATHIONE S-TRANSFERASE 3 [Cephalotrichum gorgonifer]
MATVTVELPREYGWVILSGVLTTLVNQWQGGRVTSFRKAAGIPYPYHYASKEQVDAAESDSVRDRLNRFNCAQRAHGNFLENQGSTLFFIVAAGLRYPIASAALGAWWSFNRILFATGYTDLTKKNGSGRYRGAGQYLGTIGLFILTVKTAFDLLL